LRQNASGGADLDNVRTILDDLADLVLYVLNPVSHAFVGGVVFERKKIIVAMSAGDTERGTAYQHARSGHIAGVDGVAQSDVAVAPRPHVPNRGEASFQRDPGIVGSGQSF